MLIYAHDLRVFSAACCRCSSLRVRVYHVSMNSKIDKSKFLNTLAVAIKVT